MGVTGLLGLLKSIQKPCSVKAFSGQTIGIDAYGWLHRAAVPCAIELAQGRPTTKLVDFAMHRVRMLLHFGVTPYLVFDGDHLPSKAGTEKARAQRRESARSAGVELLRFGKTAQAHQELQKAVDITPELARTLIDELKRNNISYIVAPYEADSQLVYLERKGVIDAILSEDSDLLVFGAKCLLTKLDQYGECVMIRQDDFTACREVNLVGWTVADFRRMAILSGCDYLEGIHNMGLRTAHRLVRKHKTIEILIRSMQLEGKFRVPAGYLESFTQADSTFLYQWVYCPESQQLVNLTTPESVSLVVDLPYLGACVERNTARLVAIGDLHPMTKRPITVTNVYGASRKPPLVQKMTNSAPGKGKSIDQFFRPTRVPLAELNPNAFTPSPSQQRLLRGGVGSWSAEGVGFRATVMPSAVQSIPRPLIPARAVSSAPNPLKRPRLCTDAVDGTGDQCSKFFTRSMPDPSPSLRRGLAGKKARASDITIWSDDSIEEAMAALPELSSSVMSASSKVEAVTPANSNAKTKLETTKELDSTPLDFETTPPRRAIVQNEPQESVFSAALLTQMCGLHETCQNDDVELFQRTRLLTGAVDVTDAHEAEPATPPKQSARSGCGSCPTTSTDDLAEPVLETPTQEDNTMPKSHIPVAAVACLPRSPNTSCPSFRNLTASSSPYLRIAAKGSEDLLGLIPTRSGAEGNESADEEDDNDCVTESPINVAGDGCHTIENEASPLTKLDLRRFAFGGLAA